MLSSYCWVNAGGFSPIYRNSECKQLLEAWAFWWAHYLCILHILVIIILFSSVQTSSEVFVYVFLAHMWLLWRAKCDSKFETQVLSQVGSLETKPTNMMQPITEPCMMPSGALLSCFATRKMRPANCLPDR